jgi:hypothetical protein
VKLQKHDNIRLTNNLPEKSCARLYILKVARRAHWILRKWQLQIKVVGPDYKGTIGGDQTRFHRQRQRFVIIMREVQPGRSKIVRIDLLTLLGGTGGGIQNITTISTLAVANFA